MKTWKRAQRALRSWPFRKKTPTRLPEHHVLEANRNLRELLEDTAIPAALRQELDHEFRELEAMLDKLSAGEIHIAVFGRVGAGKSSLLNALVGKSLFAASPLHGHTREAAKTGWQSMTDENVCLIDTPGIDELDGQAREALARQIARRADILLMVCEGDLSSAEFEALEDLSARQRPVILVMNKADRYTPSECESLLQRLRERCAGMVPPDRVLAVSADPRPVRVIREGPDGQEQESFRTRDPDVHALRDLLWGVLEREGKTLSALNAALFASELDAKIATRIVEARQVVAQRIIHHYCLAKGLAVAVNPVPVADLLAAAGIDVALVIHLGKVYGFSLSRREAIGLLVTIATQLAALMGAYWGVNLASSALKTVSAGLSTAVTATAQGALAWYATYLTGMISATWFRRGKSWGDAGPRETVRAILDNLDRDSILAQARDEIAALLDRPDAGALE